MRTYDDVMRTYDDVMCTYDDVMRTYDDRTYLVPRLRTTKR